MDMFYETLNKGLLFVPHKIEWFFFSKTGGENGDIVTIHIMINKDYNHIGDVGYESKLNG